MSRLETAIEALRLGDLDVHGAWLTRDSNVLKMLAPEYFGSLPLVLRIRGRFEEAFEYLESPGTPVGLNAEIFTAYDMHRGYCLGLLGRYEASRRLLTGAEARALDSCLFDLHCQVLRRAMVMFLQRDYVSSDRIYRSLLEEDRETLDWYVHSGALAGAGKVLMIQRQYSEAVPWLQRALAIVENKRAKYAMARLWADIAVCELGMGNHAKALELLQDAERVNLELGALPNFQVCVANIGNIHYATGNYLKAIAHYQRALKIAQEIKDPVSIQKWSHNIGFAFSKSREQAAKPGFVPI